MSHGKVREDKTCLNCGHQVEERFCPHCGQENIEKYVENPRHIEIQVIADKYGNVLHLGERDCSIQRRHQKVIEIAPSPLLNNEARKELYRIATKAMFKLGYESVGTVEF